MELLKNKSCFIVIICFFLLQGCCINCFINFGAGFAPEQRDATFKEHVSPSVTNIKDHLRIDGYYFCQNRESKYETRQFLLFEDGTFTGFDFKDEDSIGVPDIDLIANMDTYKPGKICTYNSGPYIVRNDTIITDVTFV